MYILYSIIYTYIYYIWTYTLGEPQSDQNVFSNKKGKLFTKMISFFLISKIPTFIKVYFSSGFGLISASTPSPSPQFLKTKSYTYSFSSLSHFWLWAALQTFHSPNPDSTYSTNRLCEWRRALRVCPLSVPAIFVKRRLFCPRVATVQAPPPHRP